MRKAFTLSEALVTLAIIGVLAAILIPVLDNVRPDKDKITYKKALYSMQSAISNAMDTSVYSMAANAAAYWKDNNVSDESFCEAIAEALNTSGKIRCTTDSLPGGKSSYTTPNFITTDGIRYWGLEGKFDDDAEDRTIYVDRGLGSKEIKKIADKRHRSGSNTSDNLGLKIKVSYDGKVSTPDDPNYEFENNLIESSMQISEGR